MSTKQRTFYRGTTEFLEVSVTSDFELDNQTVAISFDRTTWHPAAWVGDPGPTRTARLLMDGATMPTGTSHSVYVRVTDSPEAPVMRAGALIIR